MTDNQENKLIFKNSGNFHHGSPGDPFAVRGSPSKELTLRYVDGALIEQLTTTQQKLDIAVEALEFYADNYRTLQGYDGKRTYYYTEPNEHVQNDDGKTAKAALANIKE